VAIAEEFGAIAEETAKTDMETAKAYLALTEFDVCDVSCMCCRRRCISGRTDLLIAVCVVELICKVVCRTDGCMVDVELEFV
jgi:hypothetical protein